MAWGNTHNRRADPMGAGRTTVTPPEIDMSETDLPAVGAARHAGSVEVTGT